MDNIPPEILAAAETAKNKIVPKKSEERYKNAYEAFIKWQIQQGAVGQISEIVMLAYFKMLSEKHVPTTLWGIYSMIKKIVILKHGIDISKFNLLIAFIKTNAKGYTPTNKAKIFYDNEIYEFLTNAPDAMFLLEKVAAIFGVVGACRTDELLKMKINDVKDEVNDEKKTYIVKIPKDNKTQIERFFTISNAFHYDTVKKYISLRPTGEKTNRFFINYKDGRCTNQPVGIHKLSKIPHTVAKFLQLDEPEKYTGHSFRRTSASIVSNHGGDSDRLQNHGGWSSSKVAKAYVESSVNYKKDTEKIITEALEKAGQSTENRDKDETQRTENREKVETQTTNYLNTNNTRKKKPNTAIEELHPMLPFPPTPTKRVRKTNEEKNLTSSAKQKEDISRARYSDDDHDDTMQSMSQILQINRTSVNFSLPKTVNIGKEKLLESCENEAQLSQIIKSTNPPSAKKSSHHDIECESRKAEAAVRGTENMNIIGRPEFGRFTFTNCQNNTFNIVFK